MLLSQMNFLFFFLSRTIITNYDEYYNQIIVSKEIVCNQIENCNERDQLTPLTIKMIGINVSNSLRLQID